jgi:hypothetical protein
MASGTDVKLMVSYSAFDFTTYGGQIVAGRSKHVTEAQRLLGLKFVHHMSILTCLQNGLFTLSRVIDMKRAEKRRWRRLKASKL